MPATCSSGPGRSAGGHRTGDRGAASHTMRGGQRPSGRPGCPLARPCGRCQRARVSMPAISTAPLDPPDGAPAAGASVELASHRTELRILGPLEVVHRGEAIADGRSEAARAARPPAARRQPHGVGRRARRRAVGRARARTAVEDGAHLRLAAAQGRCRDGAAARRGRRLRASRSRPRPSTSCASSGCAGRAGRRWPRATPRTAPSGCARRSRCGAGPRSPSSRSRSRAAEAAHLEELRLVGLEDRIDAELALGHHADVVGELAGARRRATRCASGLAAS